jgi:hypothetical protein
LRGGRLLEHVKAVIPIELLRGLIGLIGVGSACMAGRTLAAVRQGLLKPGRHYAWVVRAVVCLAALVFRHAPDALTIGCWALSAAAFAGGWWQVSHRKPPEDLSKEIVPPDE